MESGIILHELEIWPTCEHCSKSFVCYSENDETLYLNPDFDDCPDFPFHYADFSFNLYFQDAAGNIDYLAIDSSEENEFPNYQTLSVYCENFPLTISWDPKFSNNESIDHSFLADWHPDAWFDAGSGEEQGPFLLSKSNSITLPYLNRWMDNAQPNQQEKDLYVLYFSFCSKENFETLTSLDEPEISSVTIYPNPVKDLLQIKSDHEIEKVSVFSITGSLCKEGNTSLMDISSVENGVYFVKIELKSNGAESMHVVKKIIKGVN